MKLRNRKSLAAVPAVLVFAAALWWWFRTAPDRRTIEEISDGVE